VVEAAIASLANALGATRRRIESLVAAWWWHDWVNDPFARGAYSYVRPGGRQVHEQLAEPIAATLFFAGEATDAEYPATVAGAIQSGERAAREILAGH